ncbi:hypothetical protein [Pseudomonas sp. 34 E 7]|nr:hypothetical protein [Pseudomonas sp. 34 E 7]CRN04074.1 hypothetical protein [Pseudomonas sp. 34 E 7]
MPDQANFPELLGYLLQPPAHPARLNASQHFRAYAQHNTHAAGRQAQ